MTLMVKSYTYFPSIPASECRHPRMVGTGTLLENFCKQNLQNEASRKMQEWLEVRQCNAVVVAVVECCRCCRMLYYLGTD